MYYMFSFEENVITYSQSNSNIYSSRHRISSAFLDSNIKQKYAVMYKWGVLFFSK